MQEVADFPFLVAMATTHCSSCHFPALRRERGVCRAELFSIQGWICRKAHGLTAKRLGLAATMDEYRKWGSCQFFSFEPLGI